MSSRDILRIRRVEFERYPDGTVDILIENDCCGHCGDGYSAFLEAEVSELKRWLNERAPLV